VVRALKFACALALVLVGVLCRPCEAREAHEPTPQAQELLRQASNKLAEGRLQEAQALCQQAVSLDFDAPATHSELGLTYSRQDKLLDAAREYSEAIKQDPAFLPGLINLGFVMYRQNNYAAAIEYFNRAREVERKQGKPASPEVLTNIASAYRDRATFQAQKTAERENDFKQAREYYRLALEVSPNYAQAHNNLGICLMRQRDFAEAEKEVKQAIALKSDYAFAYFNLGLVCQAQDKNKEALQAYKDSLRFETVPQYKESTRRKIEEIGVPVRSADHLSRGLG
jgi:Flp pilus assembly protein TadD